MKKAAASLRLAGDVQQPADRLSRIPAPGRFPGEHQGRRPVQHGVVHVQHLRPGGGGVLRHGVQQLGHHQEGLPGPAAPGGNVLLGGGQVQASTLIIGGICLDDNAKTVTVDGDTVNLTPLEYDILRLLMQHPGKVFSPHEIYRRVWHEDPAADNPVAVHVRHIREKIEINPAEPRYLKVVWGKGYKMEGTAQ